MAPGNIYMLLDEPTSVLEQEEIDILFGVIRKIKERAGIVFVSHRLDEVIEISDIIYVLKDGQVVKTLARGEATPPLIHELMVGRSAAQSYYRETDRKPPSDKVLLEIAGLGKADAFQGIDLTLHEGEVIALVGTEGAGDGTADPLGLPGWKRSMAAESCFRASPSPTASARRRWRRASATFRANARSKASSSR